LTTATRRGIAIGVISAVCCWTGAVGAQPCPGDIDGDNSVTVDEILTSVNSALDGCSSARFVDNGDGTVTDYHTGLMWEQKTGTPGSGVDCSMIACSDPRDVNNRYQWSASGTAADGGLFTDFVDRLNGRLCDRVSCAGLAGFSDWRVPTQAELRSIHNVTVPGCGSDPCIDAVFGPTMALEYWSATTFLGAEDTAWVVSFNESIPDLGRASSKTNRFHIRAVRGVACCSNRVP
jgi:hypothetical protein